MFRLLGTDSVCGNYACALSAFRVSWVMARLASATGLRMLRNPAADAEPYGSVFAAAIHSGSSLRFHLKTHSLWTRPPCLGMC